MNKKNLEEEGEHYQQLRKRAEEALRGSPIDLDDLPTKDIQYLLHELQVHQAELSLQNEELRRVQQDLENSRAMYSNLYDFAPAGYCTLNGKGHILNSNLTLANLLEVDRKELPHHLLSDFVAPDDQDAYHLHRQRVLKSHQRQVSEIRLVKPTRKIIFVRLESVIGPEDDTQLMVMLSDITEQHRLEKQQQENAAQMLLLQRRLIERSEMERVELARNLHDGPIQRLSGVGFSIQIIKEILKEDGGNCEANLQQLGEDIKNLLVELREITNDLRPPVLTRFGLRRALQENIAEFQERYPQVKITLELNEYPRTLPDPVALAFYRIYQSAMSNVLHHSNASEAWVRLRLEPSQILFEIQDNGQGLPDRVDLNENARQGHLGLVGMKERADAIGGNIEFLSKPGEGVIVRVTVPWSEVTH